MRFRSRAANYIRSAHTLYSSYKKEIVSSLISSLVLLILSPFSIALGFSLTDYLSRPILSIEHISYIEDYKSGDLTPLAELMHQSYTYKEYRNNPYNRQYLDLTESKSYEKDNILTAIDQYSRFCKDKVTEFEAKIIQLDNMDIGELSIWSLYYLGSTFEETSISKQELLSFFEKRIKTINVEIAQYKNILSETKNSISNIKFKVLVLNRGSTDGLIKNEGSITIEGKLYTISRTSPPPSKDKVDAVPVFNVLPTDAGTYSPKSVGKVEKNSMAEFWFELNDTSYLNKVNNMSSEFIMTLIDQDNKNIKRKHNEYL